MPAKYRKLEDFEEITLKYKDGILAFACCDCGLVHQIAFHVYRGGVLGMAHKRHSKATAQLRRHNYGNLQQGHSKLKYKMKRNEV